MAILRRLPIVKSTHDRILQAYMRLNNDSDDGIYLNVINRNNSPGSITPGEEVVGTNIIKRSHVYPNESVRGLILDTNHEEEPNGYIISLCFHTFNNNSSKLYMGRVNINGTNLTWVQCSDSPKTYQNSEILGVFSSFLTGNGGSPIKTVLLRTASTDEIVIIERH